MEHILCLSHGKDSTACLGAIEELRWSLDRIICADIWATDTIPADLPPMVEFITRADAIIKDRWGIEVEHVRSEWTAEQFIYRKRQRGKRIGKIVGWPMTKGLKTGCELQKALKIHPMHAVQKDAIMYIGIATDEPDRFHILTNTKKSPLVEAGWTELDCHAWCAKNGLLSPIYTTATRSGCWFCPNQSIGQLRLLRRNYPEYWELMLKWDRDSPFPFKADGHTIHDFDLRFQAENSGLVPNDRRFRWAMLKGIGKEK